MKIPGDPRNNYLARMDWAANSTELAIQQLNRRQTVEHHVLRRRGDRASRSRCSSSATARGSTSTTTTTNWGPGPSLHWLDDNSAFVYLSERDGWRHAYLVSRDGTMRLITPGNYDVMKVSYIDTKGGWLYFYASPENATQMYLWRIALAGGEPERLTPARRRGTHEYDIGPHARFAIHTASSWGTPPVVGSRAAAVARRRARARRQSRAQGEARAARAGADRVHADRHRRRREAGHAGSCGRRTSIRRRSIRCCSTSTASRADQTVRDDVRRRALALASDADAAGLHRRERRQPRHARTARPRLAKGGAATRSVRCACTSSRRRRASSRVGRTSTRRAWACGDGAAADRRRCC